MALRALLYRRPSEPSSIQVAVRPVDLSGAAAPASPGAALHAAHRRRLARSRSHHAAARQLREARDFAQKHGAWIAARLKRLPQAAPFAHGSEVPLRGDPHRIVHRRGVRGTVWTATDDDGNRLLCVAGEAPHINRRIGDFLRRAAARELEAAARRYAEELNVTIKRISIRDQSSRWGSCSNTGVLSFSWRLILAPPYVLDYLAAHEVAHLVELNHSARFWRLVERIYPDFERAKVWLEVHGTDLHRYGVPDDSGTRDRERRRASDQARQYGALSRQPAQRSMMQSASAEVNPGIARPAFRAAGRIVTAA